MTIESKKENRQNLVRDAKNNIILDAALRAFAEKGFHETRMEDIAAYSGFSKASLYNYYKDKDSIFLALAVRTHRDVLVAAEERISDSKSFEENISIFLNSLFDTVGKYFAVLIALTDIEFITRIAELIPTEGTSDSVCEQVLEQFRRYDTVISRLIENARKKGEIGSNLNSGTLAVYFTALIKGVLFEWKRTGKMGNPTEAVQQIVSFLKEGFNITTKEIT